jgi:hypothetical protein
VIQGGPIRHCHCKLCLHRTGVETPLHPVAFEWWAREIDREEQQMITDPRVVLWRQGG